MGLGLLTDARRPQGGLLVQPGSQQGAHQSVPLSSALVRLGREPLVAPMS
jgi:hypothetical protein